MAKRKIPAKKSVSRNSRTKRTSSRSRTPKMYIPTTKTLALCAIILTFCTMLLIITTLLDTNNKKSVSKQKNTIESTSKTKQSENSKKNISLKQKTENSSETFSKQNLPTKNTNQVQPEKNNSVESISKSDSPKKDVTLLSSKSPEIQDSRLSDLYDSYNFPVAVNNPRLAIIFDDGGQNMTQLEKCISLPFPVTIAVLPNLANSRMAADRTRQTGNEVMLHQPMQALNLNVNPGPGAITPDMSLEEVVSTIQQNVLQLGKISGINNHEGSLICEDELRIGTVLQTANNLGLYFVDSRTTSQTRVPQAAMSMGYSYYERNIFLDNTKNPSDIIAEIKKGLDIANKKGFVIMIGHIWSADVLPDILQEIYPILHTKGYKFTTVSKSGGLITP